VGHLAEMEIEIWGLKNIFGAKRQKKSGRAASFF
jgi:hypothetical protein